MILLLIFIAMWAAATFGCFLLLAARPLRPLALPSGLALACSVPVGFVSLWVAAYLAGSHSFRHGFTGGPMLLLELATCFAVGATFGAFGGAIAGAGLNRLLGLHLRHLPFVRPALRWWFSATPMRWTARRG